MRENSTHCSFTVFWGFFIIFWASGLSCSCQSWPLGSMLCQSLALAQMGLCGAEAAGEQRAAVISALPLLSKREILSYAGRFCPFAADSLIMAKEKKEGKLRAELFGCFNLVSRNTWLSPAHVFATLGIAAGLVKELGQVLMAKSWQAFNWDSYGMKDEGQALQCIMTGLGEKHIYPHTNCIFSAQSSRWAHQQKYFGSNSLSSATEVPVHSTLGFCGF